MVQGQQKGPLFLWPDGTMLTRHIFASALAKIIRNLNLSTQRHNTHSFRIGAAMSANQAGFTSHQIKALGRWRSDAYQRYTRISPNVLATLTKQLHS